MKVAVVGSGLAGLTAAYRLVKGSEDREVEVEVHLFEKVSILVCPRVAVMVSAVPRWLHSIWVLHHGRTSTSIFLDHS